MDFNEWFAKKDFKQGNTPCYVSKFAWDYQQNKIDQLEKDKQELIDCLISNLNDYSKLNHLIIDHHLQLHPFTLAEKETTELLIKLTGKSIEELLK